MLESDQEPDAATPRVFATTHWSVVVAAGQGASVPAQHALETLCRGYWYPIYVYVRRKGYGPDDAQDLTQEFFTQLIAKGHLRLADREKGKFRTFLLVVLDHFLAREWTRAHSQKRGGQFTFIPLDQHQQSPEQRYRLEPADNNSPEKTFLRQWALAILEEAMNALEKECEANDKEVLFRGLKHLLAGDSDGPAQADIAQQLGMTEGSLRVALHRLRRRYGELLRSEIARTVGGPEEVEEEVRCLLQAVTKSL